jgi:hypothetical protein
VAEYDLGASVNRDLRRRVRVVNGITSHKPVAQNDLRQAAKLIALHDHRAGLYFDDEVKQGMKYFHLNLTSELASFVS